MKILCKLLAFFYSGYVWLRVLGQYMAMPQSEPLPADVIALRTFAALLTLCCVVSLFSPTFAAVVSALGAVAYSVVSWKVNATWVFQADLFSPSRGFPYS